MRSLRTIALFLLFTSFAAAQTVTVNAAHLGGPTPLTGVITFQPTLCDAAGTAASATLSGGAGITAKQPRTAPVSAGAFTLPNLIDSSTSSPQNIGYAVSVRTSNGLQALGPGYSCVQPAANNTWCSGGVCNFDNYKASISPLIPQTTGPQGESAYQVWLDAGNTGTLQQFLAALVGPVSVPQLYANDAGLYNRVNAALGGAPIPNLFWQSAAQPGLLENDNVVHTDNNFNVGFVVTDYIPCYGATQWVANAETGFTGAARTIYYDQSGNVLQTVNADVASGTVNTIPTGITPYSFRTSLKSDSNGGNLEGTMIVLGGTLPSGYVKPGIQLPENVNLVREATAIHLGEPAQTARLQSMLGNGTYNLLDPSTFQSGAYTYNSGPVVVANSGYVVFTMRVAGFTSLVSNTDIGGGGNHTDLTLWLNEDLSVNRIDSYNYTSGARSAVYPRLTPFAVPTGAAYMVSFIGVNSAFPPPGWPGAYGYNTSGYMVAGATGTNTPTLPTQFVPFRQRPYSLAHGRNYAFVGDSILTMQPIAKMVVGELQSSLAFQDAAAGRQTANMLQNWNYPDASFTQSLIVAGKLPANAPQTPGVSNGLITPAGNTLAQDLAGVDCLFLESMGNDLIPGSPATYLPSKYGSYTDTKSATGSLVARLRYILDILFTAKPSLKLILVTPFAQPFRNSNYPGLTAGQIAQSNGPYDSPVGIYEMAVPVAQDFGVKVVNGAANGMNRYNTNAYLPDALHESLLGGFKYVAPQYVRAAEEFFGLTTFFVGNGTV